MVKDNLVFSLLWLPRANWADFAEEIFKNIKGYIVDRIKSEAFPSFVKRPLNSKLDCKKLKTVFNIEPDDWKNDLKLVLSELGE